MIKLKSRTKNQGVNTGSRRWHRTLQGYPELNLVCDLKFKKIKKVVQKSKGILEAPLSGNL